MEVVIDRDRTINMFKCIAMNSDLFYAGCQVIFCLFSKTWHACQGMRLKSVVINLYVDGLRCKQCGRNNFVIVAEMKATRQGMLTY